MRWKQIVGWTFTALLALLLMFCVIGYLFLKSGPFNEFARRKIAEAAQQATGAPTGIGGLEFSLSKLTAHLYNITMHGKESADQPPLLTIEEITVRFKIQSLIHHEVNLSELIVVHPSAHIEVTRAGASNIPTPPLHGGSHTSIFQLAIQHAQLNRGEVAYNDQKIPIDADLYNLNSDIRFDASKVSYSGFLSYENGQLRYGEYAPLPHSLQARFSATPNQLTIGSAQLRIGHSAVSLRANLQNYADPVVEGDYKLRIDARDFNSLAPAYRPAGNLSLAGQIHYDNATDRPMLRRLSIGGEFKGELLSAVSAGRRIFINRLRGKFQLANGALQANAIQIDTVGGRVDADLNLQHLDAIPSGRLRASLQDISLQAVQRTLREDIKQIAVTGTVNGTADASWTGSLAKARLRSDLAIGAVAKDSSRGTDNSSASQIPVNGVIHATYDGARNAVTLHRSTLRIPAAVLAADGEVSRSSHLHVQASIADLHRIESLFAAFRPKSPALAPVSGSATFNANLEGSLTRPRIEGKISAQNLNVQGTGWRTAQAAFEASPSRVVITEGALVSSQNGRAAFSGTVALHDWHYEANNWFTANLSLQKMSIADLRRSVSLQYPIGGDLSANISLSGTELNPQGSGKIQLTNARIYEQSVQTMAAQFHSDHGTLISSLHLAIPAGTADGNLSYTFQNRTYMVRFDAPSLLLQKLQVVQTKNLPLSGTVTVSASGQGTLDNPQLNASLRLPQVMVQGKSISDTDADLQVANHKANLNLNSKVVDAAVQIRAQVNLTGDYYTEASIETGTIPLNVLLATYLTSLPQGFTGQTELHATLQGPLKDQTKLEAHIAIPALNASYQSLQIGIASPVHAEFVHSVLTVQPAEIRGTGTSLRIQGSIPFAGDASPSLTAEGSLDVGILKIFSPDTTSSGAVSFNVHASGNAQNPNLSGEINLHDVAVLYSGAPVGVSKMNGTLGVANNSIQISKVTGEVGGGNIVLGGAIVYRPQLQCNLLLQGTSIRLLYPTGLRTLLDTNLSFTGNKQSSSITGRVLIDSLGFTPDFDLSTFANQFSGTTLPAESGVAENVKLNISVQSKDNLTANSSQVSIEGSVNARVVGTAANPVIIGRTDLTAGEVFYRNVRYQIQRGIITFDNPNQTSPVLNVSVTTTVEQYNLTLRLTGPFDKLATSYISDPPLATADIISLLAQGQTTEEAAAAGQSTDSILASQAASQFVGGIQKLAGISSLSIDPLIGGNNANPSARIAIQQRVTKNFLFTFSTDVSQPGGEIVQGDYQINKRWSVNVTRDQVGGVSMGGELHTHF
jgi:translocation and assembly module TamB